MAAISNSSSSPNHQVIQVSSPDQSLLTVLDIALRFFDPTEQKDLGFFRLVCEIEGDPITREICLEMGDRNSPPGEDEQEKETKNLTVFVSQKILEEHLTSAQICDPRETEGFGDHFFKMSRHGTDRQFAYLLKTVAALYTAKVLWKNKFNDVKWLSDSLEKEIAAFKVTHRAGIQFKKENGIP